MTEHPLHDKGRESQAPLSSAQADLILSLFPAGSFIHATHSFQPGYGPGPVRVEVQMPDNGRHVVVLRLSRHGNVATETRLFELLGRFQLPVPKVLAGPVPDPAHPELGFTSVLSLLPGKNLQWWSETSAAGLDLAMRLANQAITRLHRVTEDVRQDPLATALPHHTLLDELRAIESSGEPRLAAPLFHAAIQALRPVLAAIDTPLIFSNGDYQPGNFLSDGHVLTGFVDFENACFEDPHVGVAKYRIYDLHPLNKAGFVAHYLQTQHLTETDFAPRLALRCLWTLQREIPVQGGSANDQSYRAHVLRLLEKSLNLLA